MSYFLYDSDEKKILAVRYNSQRDNFLNPTGACNVTCVAMQIEHFINNDEIFDEYEGFTFHQKIANTIKLKGFKNLSLDDKIFAIINSEQFKKYFFTKYHRELWIKKYFETCRANEVFICLVEFIRFVHKDYRFASMSKKLSLDLICNEINNCYPVTICGKFTSGHFVCVIGYDLVNKLLICHDPWGNYNRKYLDKNGAFVEYKLSLLFKQGFLINIPILIHFDKKVKAI